MPPTNKPALTTWVTPLPVAVIGIEYQIAGEPTGCVSVTVSVIDPGTFMIDPLSPIVTLGDGELTVTVTGPLQ